MLSDLVSDCVTLNARQDTKPGLVTIVIVTDDSACSSVPSGYLLVPALPDWAIAVIVVGAVIVAGAVILTAILVSNKQKKVASRKMSHKLNWKGSWSSFGSSNMIYKTTMYSE